MTSHLQSVPSALDVESTPTAVVAGNARAEMARRRVTQQRLAHRLGISQQGVSARLNGRVAFSVDELVAVADELGVTPAALLERSAS